MNGKVERCERTVGEEFHSRHFYESLGDMEEGLRTYVEYYNKFRPHMDLHGLTPYEKLEGLVGGRTSKSFEVCNNLPLDKISNFGTLLNIKGAIKNERVCSHPI
jgi:hypothetical protein